MKSSSFAASRTSPTVARNRSDAEDCPQVGAEDFHSYVAFMLQIAGQIHGCHPTGAKFALDGIAFGQRRTKLLCAWHGRLRCSAQGPDARTRPEP